MNEPATTRTSAVAYLHSGPIDRPDAFVDVEIDVPPPQPHDLLVDVRAVSVNPVDVRSAPRRIRTAPPRCSVTTPPAS